MAKTKIKNRPASRGGVAHVQHQEPRVDHREPDYQPPDLDDVETQEPEPPAHQEPEVDTRTDAAPPPSPVHHRTPPPAPDSDKRGETYQGLPVVAQNAIRCPDCGSALVRFDGYRYKKGDGDQSITLLRYRCRRNPRHMFFVERS